MAHPFPRVAALALVAALGLAACGDDHAEGETHSHDTTGATAATAASSTGAGAAVPTTAAATGVTTTGVTTTGVTAATGTVIELNYKAGKVEGGGRKQVTKGQNVTLRVTSDVVDEVHVHGFDKKVDLVVGQAVDLTFKADASGVFEVELEKKGLKLLDLEVK